MLNSPRTHQEALLSAACEAEVAAVSLYLEVGGLA
jgi:hypothetical protein